MSRKERSQQLGSRPAASMEALNSNLEALVESLKPNSEEVRRQELAFEKVCPLLTQLKKPEYVLADLLMTASLVAELNIARPTSCSLRPFQPSTEWAYS